MATCVNTAQIISFFLAGGDKQAECLLLKRLNVREKKNDTTEERFH